MSEEEPDYRILMKPGLTEKEIAEVLRRGPSEIFLQRLAMMLDPLPINWKTEAPVGVKRPTHKKTTYRLKLLGPPNRAKGSGNVDMYALGVAMIEIEDLHGLRTREYLEEKRKIMTHFGVSDRHAERAKAAEKANRELFAWTYREDGKK